MRESNRTTGLRNVWGGSRRIAEFTRGALPWVPGVPEVPGVREVHVRTSDSVMPPREQWETARQRCLQAKRDPKPLDGVGIEKEKGTSVLLVRSTARLFGLVTIDVDDVDSFSLYEDLLVNVANAIVMALDASVARRLRVARARGGS